MNRIILCCGKKGCPVITKEPDEMVKITDDFGNHVKMSLGEARLIDNALTKMHGPAEEPTDSPSDSPASES